MGELPDEVERCRVASDPGGAEELALGALLGADGEDFETLVAFALAAREEQVG